MDNQTKHKIEGQEYSNNCIESMQDILDINYLITWGGPGYRLQIILDSDNRIVSVEPQYQDWFTEWQTVPTTSKQRETLINFAYSLGLEDF